MQVSFLYWEECPSHERALERLRAVMEEEGIEAEVELIEVKTEEQAKELRFVGSPTIRIDGVDIDPPSHEVYGLDCRIYYLEDGRVSPLPSEEMIRDALRAAKVPNE